VQGLWPHDLSSLLRRTVGPRTSCDYAWAEPSFLPAPPTMWTHEVLQTGSRSSSGQATHEKALSAVEDLCKVADVPLRRKGRCLILVTFFGQRRIFNLYQRSKAGCFTSDRQCCGAGQVARQENTNSTSFVGVSCLLPCNTF